MLPSLTLNNTTKTVLIVNTHYVTMARTVGVLPMYHLPGAAETVPSP